MHLFVVLDSAGPRPAATGAVSFKSLRNALQNQVNNFEKPLKTRAFFRILHIFVVLDSTGPRPAAADAFSFKSSRNALQNQAFFKTIRNICDIASICFSWLGGPASVDRLVIVWLPA